MPSQPSTPEERRAAKAEKRQVNRVAHVTARAQKAAGHQKVIVACNAALAASKRITAAAQMDLARAIAVAAEQADSPANRKESR